MITEVDESGQKARGFVYSGGSVLVVQKKIGSSEYVEWQHRDASNATYRVTVLNGAVDTSQSGEIDPLGRDAGARNTYAFPRQRTGADYTYAGFGDATTWDCMLDGIPYPCSTVQNMQHHGAGTPWYAGEPYPVPIVPVNRPAPHRDIDKDKEPHVKDTKEGVAGTHQPQQVPGSGRPTTTVTNQSGVITFTRTVYVTEEEYFEESHSIDTNVDLPFDPQEARLQNLHYAYSYFYQQDQDPLKEKIGKLIPSAARLGQANKQAWDEFTECLNSHELIKKYYEESAKLGMFDDPIEDLLKAIPTFVASRTLTKAAIRARKGSKAASLGNAIGAITTILQQVLYGSIKYGGAVSLLREKYLEPAIRDCLERVKSKYGFEPSKPKS